MAFFPAPLSREESDALAARIRQKLNENEFGLWALEIPGVADFAGFVGLAVPTFEAHFTPCVEVGWRLARPYWGRGYATEAAAAVLDYAFNTLDLKEVVSFTASQNLPSRAVMARLGMQHDGDQDFNHPSLPQGHVLQRHVLYRLPQLAWYAR